MQAVVTGKVGESRMVNHKGFGRFRSGKLPADEAVHYSRPAAGINFYFGIKGEGFWQKALNGFNLMAEVCPGHAEDLHTATYTVNVGGTYSIWKDHINLIAELNDGKYFIGGIFFKLHLK